jgi:glycosyltransferase involved in cell wall biosynthesis
LGVSPLSACTLFPIAAGGGKLGILLDDILLDDILLDDWCKCDLVNRGRAEKTLTELGVVLQFSSMVPPALFGGAERVVGAFSEELRRAGLRVQNHGLKPRAHHKEESGHPINNIYWPFDGRRRGVAQRTVWHAVDTFGLRTRHVVDDLLNEHRPDIVITHNLRGWGFAPWVVAGERGIPLVHVVHDYGLICNSTTLWRGGVCSGVCAACRPRLYVARRRWPGGQIVGVSNAVLSEHRARGLNDFDNAVVVYPTAAAQMPRSVRRRRTDGAPSTIGYLGRLGDAKGIDVLLAAVEGGGKRLIAAGEGERSYVERLKARGRSQVEWRGWTDPGPFFDAVDVLVVPSVWLEPFGLIVIEAARAGVPVLIANRPGLVEAARVSGARYATFSPNDAGALREALNSPLSSYRVVPASETQTNIVEVVTRLMWEGRTK